MARAIGLLANPESARDIRRIVGHASGFDNREKVSVVRRVILGAIAAGADRFVYYPDARGLVSSAIEGLDADAEFRAIEGEWAASAADTAIAASAMRTARCAVVVTLGGDGTNRGFARGWLDAPLIPLSTGTNNVFPLMVESTLAGAAAGCIASGTVAIGDVHSASKVVHVEIEGEPPDLALIDAVLLDEPFVGAKALWQVHRIRTIVLSRAEPAAVGFSAIGGLLHPVAASDDAGLVLQIGEGGITVHAPISPGVYEDVDVISTALLAPGEMVEVQGPGVLAFDGERERRLQAGQVARLCVRRDGPRVVDIERVLALAAERGVFSRRD